jgi:hypothetical protein
MDEFNFKYKKLSDLYLSDSESLITSNYGLKHQLKHTFSLATLNTTMVKHNKLNTTCDNTHNFSLASYLAFTNKNSPLINNNNSNQHTNHLDIPIGELVSHIFQMRQPIGYPIAENLPAKSPMSGKSPSGSGGGNPPKSSYSAPRITFVRVLQKQTMYK